jgi:hypothetical protein
MKAVDQPHKATTKPGEGEVEGELFYSAAWLEYADTLYCPACGFVTTYALYENQCPQCYSEVEEMT